MEYVDERIAMLERESRRQKREEAQRLEKAEAEKENRVPKMTLEEMFDSVRNGTVTFPGGETCTLETRIYFEDKIPMILIKDFYTGIEETPAVAVFVNHDQNVSQILTVADKPLDEQSIGKWKKQLVSGMKAVNTYAEVTKEIVLENIDYLIYRTPTGKGWTYNVIFRIRSGSNKVVGNYNCFEKDKDTYGLLLEALVLRLNELLSMPFEEMLEGE